MAKKKTIRLVFTRKGNDCTLSVCGVALLATARAIAIEWALSDVDPAHMSVRPWADGGELYHAVSWTEVPR
jgi:hypothetical protein